MLGSEYYVVLRSAVIAALLYKKQDSKSAEHFLVGVRARYM